MHHQLAGSPLFWPYCEVLEVPLQIRYIEDALHMKRDKPETQSGLLNRREPSSSTFETLLIEIPLSRDIY